MRDSATSLRGIVILVATFASAVAYTRNTPMTIQSFLPWVDSGVAPTGGPNPGPNGLVYRAIHDRGGPNQTMFVGSDAVPAVADRNLPNHIDYKPAYHLEWDVSFNNGDTWFPIGNTTHEVYVTLDDPASPSVKVHTFFDIAVRSALGATTAEQMIDLVWQEFADREVDDRNGWVMGYYRGVHCPSDCTVYDPYNLIITGDGQCGSWAHLFAQCLDLHGTAEINWVTVEPDASALPPRCSLPPNSLPSDTRGFLINNYWQSISGQTGCDAFPLRMNSPCLRPWIAAWPDVDIIDMPGLPGQDTDDPASFFERHFIIQVGDGFFDPSYGGTAWYPASINAAAALWENSAVSAYYDIVNIIEGSSGLQIQYGARNNNSEIRESRFLATPY